MSAPTPSARSAPGAAPGARPRSRPGTLVCALVLLLAAGCGQQGAIGEANTVVVVAASDSVWQQMRDTTKAVLEPTFFSTREEKRFYVEGVDTTSSLDFQRLRQFRQVALFGTPDDRFVREAMEAADLDPADVSPPTVFETSDLWAGGQHVVVVVLDPDRPTESWRSQLPEVADRTDAWYRDFVEGRMFVSGVDSAAMDSLGRRFGFHLRFPRVYDVVVRDAEAGPVIVRNDNPDPSDLIRSVLVAWRSPPLDSLTAGAAEAWRAAVDSVHYNVAQAMDRSRGEVRRLEVDGRAALEITGAWSDEGTEYPAAGPFVARLVDCPDRTYFLDAWVYAPGKDKYQYMLQVRNVLDSFRCG